MNRILERLTTLQIAVLLFCADSVAQQPAAQTAVPQTAVPQTAVTQAAVPKVAYPKVIDELAKQWPQNRTVRFVFHGHSVPAGYFKTPTIRRFDSYPSLFHQQMSDRFPTAAIDVCVTAIGGENSREGAFRFATDVLALKPDVVFIDYSLNDRRLTLQEAKAFWEMMIVEAQQNGIAVVLLTPTPDSREDITSADAPLQAHADQVKSLGKQYRIPVVDAYSVFQQRVQGGEDVKTYLSQINHPNRKGHQVVADLLLKVFPADTPETVSEDGQPD